MELADAMREMAEIYLQANMSKRLMADKVKEFASDVEKLAAPQPTGVVGEVVHQMDLLSEVGAPGKEILREWIDKLRSASTGTDVPRQVEWCSCERTVDPINDIWGDGTTCLVCGGQLGGSVRLSSHSTGAGKVPARKTCGTCDHWDELGCPTKDHGYCAVQGFACGMPTLRDSVCSEWSPVGRAEPSECTTEDRLREGRELAEQIGKEIDPLQAVDTSKRVGDCTITSVDVLSRLKKVEGQIGGMYWDDTIERITRRMDKIEKMLGRE
jgi:hypothetical protein